MGEFGAHAAEIVPAAAQDGLDLGGGFFREGGLQIGAARCGFRGSSGPMWRMAQPAKSASRSGLARRISLEQADGERADDGVA